MPSRNRVNSATSGFELLDYQSFVSTSTLFSLYLFECWEGKGGKRTKRQNKRGMYRERDRTAVNFLEGEGMWLERAIF